MSAEPVIGQELFCQTCETAIAVCAAPVPAQSAVEQEAALEAARSVGRVTLQVMLDTYGEIECQRCGRPLFSIVEERR